MSAGSQESSRRRQHQSRPAGPGWRWETGLQPERGGEKIGAQVQWGHGQGGGYTGPGDGKLEAASVDAARRVTGLEELPRK